VKKLGSWSQCGLRPNITWHDLMTFTFIFVVICLVPIACVAWFRLLDLYCGTLFLLQDGFCGVWLIGTVLHGSYCSICTAVPGSCWLKCTAVPDMLYSVVFGTF
jgi:hypothetical protein